nr:PREDICTED: 4-coumarate--CoA ligase-like [Megachile rotundata]
MANFTVENNILIGKELEYPETYQNAGDILLEIFQKKPDQIGQIDAVTGKTVTYKEMREKVIKCAIWLEQQGIKQGDVVAICTSCCFDNYIPFLASICIGAICALEYHELPTRVFRHFLSTVSPNIIFLHEFATKNLMAAENELNTKIQRILFEDGVRNEVSLADILSKISLSEVEKFRCAKIEDPNQVVMYIGTSGSTGVPKLAKFTHLSLKAMLNPAYSVSIKDKISMCIAGLRWMYAILFIMSAFRGNSTRIIVEDYKDAKYYGEMMKKHKVEYYGADTNQVRQIYKLDLIDLYRSTSLKIIRFGGSSFGREMHQKINELLPNIEFLQLYGSTDVGNCMATQIDKNGKPGGCGYVRAGVKIKIVNTETGEILGANRQGEICAMTDTQMKGYLNNPEMTNKTIDSEGWIHTGDIGYYDDDGELFIAGRMSEFINYNDACLSVTEMESVLERHPAVYRAAVVAIPAEVEGEVPVAFVIKVPNKEVTVNELMTHFQNNIPDYYFLSNIMFVDKFPTTTTGKVSKNDLKQLLY